MLAVVGATIGFTLGTILLAGLQVFRPVLFALLGFAVGAGVLEYLHRPRTA